MHNMDIDVYDIQNTINIGDTSATIELTSGQDLVMVNSIITVLNSQLPDASIQLADQVQSTCFSRTVVLEYTISNTNATDAFVTAHLDGQRITVQEALLMSNETWMP